MSSTEVPITPTPTRVPTTQKTSATVTATCRNRSLGVGDPGPRGVDGRRGGDMVMAPPSPTTGRGSRPIDRPPHRQGGPGRLARRGTLGRMSTAYRGEEDGTREDQPSRPGSVHRTLDILEVVAARGGASAKEIAEATGLPLPTVYRLARELLDSDYLVHIREEKRFELGYKLHQLGVSLHQQIGVPREVRAEVTALHAAARRSRRTSRCTAARRSWWSSPPTPRAAPRLRPIDFGFHEAPHAHRPRQDPAGQHGAGAARPAPRPRADAAVRSGHDHRPPGAGRPSSSWSRTGAIAWEFGEFQPGATCVAAAVRAGERRPDRLGRGVRPRGSDGRGGRADDVGGGSALQRLPGQPVLPFGAHDLSGPYRRAIRALGVGAEPT